MKTTAVMLFSTAAMLHAEPGLFKTDISFAHDYPAATNIAFHLYSTTNATLDTGTAELKGSTVSVTRTQFFTTTQTVTLTPKVQTMFVTASNSAGQSLPSVGVTLPPAPRMVLPTFTQGTNGTNWAATWYSYPTNELSTNLTFRIYASSDATPPSVWAIVKTVTGTNATTFSIPFVNSYLSMSSSNFWGESALADVTGVRPPSPTGLRLIP